MKSISIMLFALAITVNAYAQTDKQMRKEQREEKKEMRKEKAEERKAQSVDNMDRGERTQTQQEPINPVQGKMNANGNNTPTYNSTRSMNDAPRRSAIDTNKIK